MSEYFMLSTVVPDTFVVFALALTLFVMARNLRAISFAGITRELGLIMAGLLAWGAFLLAHILFLVLGPIWLSEAEMLRTDAFMQSGVRWSFETIAAIIILAGVVQIPRRFGRLMQNLEQSTSALEHEHEARSSLEAQLKAATATQRTSEQAESEFLLGLSHELRTPLNGIIGLGSLLGNTPLDADQRRLLGTLEQSAHTMLARVGAVIELSQLRTEQVEVRSQVLSPAELVRSVEALYAPSATEKGLAFSSEISEAANAQFLGDSRLTKQLLSTLASIAIKYSPVGAIRTIVDVETTGDEIAAVQFTTAATGLEFPPHVIERVRGEFGGMRDDGGIGLAICWRLAELMDGTLMIESDAEAGAVVTVRLPMRREL